MAPMEDLRGLMERQMVVQCWCHKCCERETGFYPQFKMVLCPECGNKRCPKASDHMLQCSGSNATGQPGSIYF